MSLKLSFAHVLDLMIAWTRVHAISAVLMESDACRASTSPAKGKTCGTMSHTEEIYITCMLKYRGVVTHLRYRPNFLPGGAPPGHPCGPVCVASCHESAPLAPRAGRPWLCHVASVPRHIHALVPRATSARRLGPLATSSPAVSSPLFHDLNKEKFIEKSIKIQKKGINFINS